MRRSPRRASGPTVAVESDAGEGELQLGRLRSLGGRGGAAVRGGRGGALGLLGALGAFGAFAAARRRAAKGLGRQHALMSASVRERFLAPSDVARGAVERAVVGRARATRSRRRGVHVCVSSSGRARPSSRAATSTVDSATRAAAAVDALAWRLRDARRRSSAVRAGGRGPKVEGRDARVRRARRDANHEERADVVGRVCVARAMARRAARPEAPRREAAPARTPSVGSSEARETE